MGFRRFDRPRLGSEHASTGRVGRCRPPAERGAALWGRVSDQWTRKLSAWLHAPVPLLSVRLTRNWYVVSGVRPAMVVWA